MATYRIQEETLTQLSDSVRSVSRKTQKMSPEAMSSSLNKISIAENTTFPKDTPETYNRNIFTVQGDFFEKLYELVQENMTDDDAFTLNDLVSAMQGVVGFWDDYQQNGNRQDYAGAFGGEGWTDKTFQPKYDMRPTKADYMFRKCLISDLDFILTHVLNGRTLDFSNCTNMTEAFSNTPNLTRVGVIDIRKAGTNIANMFAWSNIEYIEKIIIAETNTLTYFPGSMENLTHVLFEGVIGKTGLNLQRSTKLSKDSITSIINCLSTTTTGLTVTLSKTAVNNSFASEEGGNDGDESNEWNELVSSKPNWNISLV